MYIESRITNPTAPAVSAFTFTRKDEAGITIGTADSYSSTDYRIEQSPDQLSIYIQLLESPVFMWPPKATYPVSRLVFIDDTQIPPVPDIYS